MTAKQERVVSYFYDEEIGNFCYGGGNPMRPHRARMVFSLLKAYGLTKNMHIHRPQPRSFDQLTEFHADDYIDFLSRVTPTNAEEHMQQLKRFNMGQIGDVDCPVFDGIYEYCQLYAGGSVNGAAALASGKADVAFNWSGGMHHAKKAEASGFCYVNDIVLGILELLKVFPRVLYVDIDIHHGDGVEEAFYLTDRVMTVSFHKYGEFFPGTGALQDVGYGKGTNYCVNVPLKDGMDDDNYRFMYEPIMSKVMEMYQPGAIVMCCGADSLSGDKLGCFNLSMEGHSHCIEFLAKYNVPMMVLGGGGYTLRNVARCWCYETGRLMGVDLPDQLPQSEEHDYYLDTRALRISVSNMKNMNTREELEEIKREVLQNLSQLPPVPSVHMSYNPPPAEGPDAPEEDPDIRGGGQAADEARRVKQGYESDDEDPDRTYKGGVKQEQVAPPQGNRDPITTPAAPGTTLPSHPAPGLPSSLPVAMRAATIHTSEALQGPGVAASAPGMAAGAGPHPAAAAGQARFGAMGGMSSAQPQQPVKQEQPQPDVMEIDQDQDSTGPGPAVPTPGSGLQSPTSAATTPTSQQPSVTGAVNPNIRVTVIGGAPPPYQPAPGPWQPTTAPPKPTVPMNNTGQLPAPPANVTAAPQPGGMPQGVDGGIYRPQ